MGPRRNSAPELRDLVVPSLSMPTTPSFRGKRAEVGGYQTLKVLGRGSSSEVRKILHTKTGKLYAGKVLVSNEGTENKRTLIEQEYNLLKGLNHPNVVKVFELIVHDENEFMMI